MIDALIKRVSVTYKCYEMYAHQGKRCNCSCFEIDQEMDAILLVIGIVYGVCRIVIIPPVNKVWVYIGITLSVRPSVRLSMYLVSATPPKRHIGFL
jgi:hypothetical protein